MDPQSEATEVTIAPIEANPEIVPAPANQNNWHLTHKRGRPLIDDSDLSQDPMLLREQIRLVSQRLRRRALSSKDFMALNHLLLQLRGLLKKRHDRSENGIRFKDILRDEAKAKREALAADKEMRS